MKSIMTTRVLVMASFLSFAFAGCKQKEYFKGDLNSFTCVEDTCIIKGKVLQIDSLHLDYFGVCDSLVMFYSPMRNDFAYEVYNVNTGKKVGNFCPLGHGSDEFVSISPITHIFKEGNDTKTILFMPNESKLIKWNITQSAIHKKTCYEDIAVHTWRKESPVAYSKVFKVGSDSILTYFSSVHISGKDTVTQQKYTIRTFSDNKKLDEFSTFSAAENREGTKILPENFFSQLSCIKPDGSKLVEALVFLPQINIVDINTKGVTGFLMTGYDDYTLFDSDMSDARLYYIDVQATNDYIFALWNGNSYFDDNAHCESDILHVYDWDGNMKKVIKLDHCVSRMFYDDTSRHLFCSHMDRTELYCYDILRMME